MKGAEDCIHKYFSEGLNNLLSRIETGETKVNPRLTINEYFCIEDYILYSYHLNEYLRTNPTPVDPKFECLKFFIESGLEKLPNYNGGGTLFRGTPLPNLIFNEIIENGRLVDRAFFSTTVKRGLARQHMLYDAYDFPESEYRYVIFEILEHHSGKNISEYFGELITDGVEIIFNRNIEFRITDHSNIEYVEFSDGEKREVSIIKLEEL